MQSLDEESLLDCIEIFQRINPQEDRWVFGETAEKSDMQEHISSKCPWKLQTKLPEIMVENFQTVARIADFLCITVTGDSIKGI